MDFNIPQDGFTQFMYVLPYDKHTALCECTRFGTEAIPEDVAWRRTQEYVRRKYGQVKMEKKEAGVIPMHVIRPPETSKQVVNIGGRAGAIKPSTGYAVQFIFEHAVQICEQDS
jgi:lycopene beta-cyclase